MPASPDRTCQVGEFFEEYADHVIRVVSRRARDVPKATVEDACSTAWTILVRRDDVALDERGVSWLTTVAIRTAWKLYAGRRVEAPAGLFDGCSRDEQDEPLPQTADWLADGPEERVLDRMRHVKDVEAFRTLRSRERQVLFLQAIGLTYNQIVSVTGYSYTAVNRYITEGRRALRRGGYTSAEQARRRDAK